MQDVDHTSMQLRLLQAACDCIAEAILITTAELEPPGVRIIYANAAFTQMTGYTAAAVHGQTPPFLQESHTDQAVLDRMRHAFATGESWRAEFTYHRQDRSLSTLALQLNPIHDAHGQLTHWVAVLQDLTAYNQTEEALPPMHRDLETREQEHTTSLQGEVAARQRAAMQGQELVESAPDAMVIVDQTGHMVLVNAQTEQIFGYPRAELLGQPVEMLLPEHVRSAHHTHRTHYGANPQRRLMGAGLNLSGRRKDGSEFPMEIRLSPLETDEGILVSSSIRDMTERQQLEVQAQHTQRMQAIGNLAGGMAHQFNNILGIMMGFADLTLSEAPEYGVAWANLREILTAGERAKELIQQVLAFGRPNELERTLVHLPTIVRDALRTLRTALPTTITIQHEIADEVGMILANPTQIHQVLMNLGINAEQAMRATGGELNIRLEMVLGQEALAARHPTLQPGPYARLTVRDTGPGMAPEVLERLFEPFFTTKAAGEGSGLGLAVVHSVVTSHNGAIEVESMPGTGTTFTIHLPQQAARSMEAVLAETIEQPSKPRILVVEDDDALAYLIQRMLNRLGYEAQAFVSSPEALAAFQAAPDDFDLVITDQTMPELSGDSLVQALRQIRPAVPIILCTGYSHVMNAERAAALDIDAFLMKPLVRKDLAAAIEQCLARRRQA